MFKRVVLFIIIAVALLLAMAAADAMLLTTPGQLRARIAEILAEQLNADLQLSSISHPAFSSKVYITNFTLKSRGQDSRVFFTAREATLSLNYLGFLGGRDIKSISFENPTLTLYKSGGETEPGPPAKFPRPNPLESLAKSPHRAQMPKFIFRNAIVRVNIDGSEPVEIVGLNLVIDPAAAREKNSLTLSYEYDSERQVQVDVTIDPVTGIIHYATSGTAPNYLCLTDKLHDILARLSRGEPAGFAADFLDVWDNLGLGGVLRFESFEATYDPSKDEANCFDYKGNIAVENGTMAVKEFPYRVQLVGGHILIDGIDAALKDLNGRNDAGPGVMEGYGAIKNFLSGQSEVDLTLTAHGMPIDKKLHEALKVDKDMERIWNAIQPEGVSKTAVIRLKKQPDQLLCEASVEITFDGRASGAYTYADTDGSSKTVRVTNVDGTVDFSPTGVKIINAAGKIAGVKAAVTDGTITRPGFDDSEINVHAVTDKFAISGEVLAVLPESLRKEIEAEHPEGEFSLDLRLTKKKDDPKPAFSVKVIAHGASILSKMFPYRVEKIEGALSYENGRIWSEEGADIAAAHGGAKLTAKLDVSDLNGQPACNIEIHGEKVPLDMELYNAFPPEVREQIDNYVPLSALEAGKGTCDFACTIKGRSPDQEITVEVNVTAATVQCAHFPYLVNDVSGTLKVAPGGVYLQNLRGKHGGAELSLAGGKIEKDAVDITINAKSLAFDDDLKKALGEKHIKVYDSFQPKGAVDVLARLTRKGNGDLLPEITVTSNKTMEFTYSGFPLPATEVETEFVIAPESVKVGKLACKLGGITIPLTEKQNYCEISLGDVPRFFLHLEKAEGVRIDDQLKNAFPAGLRDSLNRMSVKGGLDISDMDLDFLMGEARARYSYKFTAALKDCSLGEKPAIAKLTKTTKIQAVANPGEQANAEGTAFEDLEFYIRGLHVINLSGAVTRLDAKDVDFKNPADPHRLDFKASLYNKGETPNIINGFFIFCLGDSKEYKGGFDFDNVDLAALHSELIGKPSNLSGTMKGGVVFRGEGEDFGNLQGSGHMNITEGNLGELPLIFSLNQLLKIDLPERQVIKDARLEFNIKDKAFNFDVMTFKSQAVNFIGYGKVDFDENLDMIVFSDTVLKIPVLEEVMRLFKRQLYPVKVTGTFSKPEMSPAVFKLITDIPGGVRNLLGLGD